jgi:hypothetical protein
MLVIWTGKPALMFASTAAVAPVVHRRGPAVRVARIDAQAERTAGRCLWTPPRRAQSRVPYLLQPRFAYGNHLRPRATGSASVWISAVGGELSFPISPACDAHGLIADPHASVARIAAKRRVAVITPAFPLAATRLPLGHINLSGCSTATPNRKPI